MANYNSTAAYDLELFNALPKREPQEFETPRVIKRKPKTKLQLKHEAKVSAVTAVKIFTTAAILFAFFGAIIISRITLTLNRRETESIKNELKTAQSENVRLNMALGAMISDDKVEEYASEVLGMKKLERYQIHYFENTESDRAVVYGNSEAE